MTTSLPNYFISSLAETLNVGGSETSVKLSTIYTTDGQIVTTADFAAFGRGVLTIDPIALNSTEFISFTDVDPALGDNGGVTGVTRGLSFKSNTSIPANKKFHVVGAPVLISWGTHNIQDVLDIITNNYNALVTLIDNTVIAQGVPGSTTIPGIYLEANDAEIAAGTPNRFYAPTNTTYDLVVRNDKMALAVETVIQNNPTFLGDSVTENASGNIAQYDYVYSNGSNTAKTVQPTSILSQSSPSTTPSFAGGTKAFKYSATKQIYFSGGAGTNQSFDVFVGTANSANTNVTFGSPTNITAEAYYFDVCEITTGHYVAIWQNASAGVANGIKVISITYNGSSVTIGSITTLETTGISSIRPSCATLDSGRALLTYMRDSNGFLAGQVIGISGNTISTNSVSDIIASSGNWMLYAVNIDNNKTFLSYNSGSGSTFTSAVVVETSGTTISAIGIPVTVATFGGGNMNGAPAYKITTNKVFVTYRNSASSTSKQQTNIITNSGNTLTVNAQTPAPNDGGVNGSGSFGQYISINNNLQIGLFVNGYASGGSAVMLLNMSGTTLSLVSVSTSVGDSAVMCLVKLAPFIYGAYGGSSSKQIINLTNPTEARLGVAMSAILNTESGDIHLPYRIVVGFTGLTAGTLYYTDDNGTYTTESSTYTREYGVAINSTTMLIK